MNLPDNMESLSWAQLYKLAEKAKVTSAWHYQTHEALIRRIRQKVGQ